MSAGLDLSPLLKHISAEEIPGPGELFDGAALAAYLAQRGDPALSVVAGGDIMLGGRARAPIGEYGFDYPFRGVRPLLARAPIVLGNLEGPLARDAKRQKRNFSYRVEPELARAMAEAGVNVVTLANNHLLDCGRRGVIETMHAVRAAGVSYIGCGHDEREAHRPVVMEAGGLRIGLLGYYWNRRCAATAEKPGSALDPPEALEADIQALRRESDRIVVTFHWGVPYERVPSAEDRAKARLAIALGADAVVGHHPHVIQPFEIYRHKPIFYSVGNFTFGSGNSRGEGLMLGIRFAEQATRVEVYPLYVKNRDPRVNYQPKVLRGHAAARVLASLAAASGEHGERLAIEDARGLLSLPYGGRSE